MDEILFDVSSHVTGCRAVKRQITTFRADDDLFTRESASVQLSECCSHGPFASLKAIVRCGINYVRADFNRADNRFGVAPISFFIRLAQVGPNANRREPQILRLAKIILRGDVPEALAIVRKSFRRGTTVN